MLSLLALLSFLTMRATGIIAGKALLAKYLSEPTPDHTTYPILDPITGSDNTVTKPPIVEPPIEDDDLGQTLPQMVTDVLHPIVLLPKYLDHITYPSFDNDAVALPTIRGQTFLPVFLTNAKPGRIRLPFLDLSLIKLELKKAIRPTLSLKVVEPPAAEDVILPKMITNLSNITSATSDRSQESRLKLHVTSVMYLVCSVVLASGAMLQIFLILKHHRNKISSFVMMLYDSFTKLFFVIILLIAVHYKHRDRVTCTVLAWLEMTCVGCICLSTSLVTLHKLIMIKFPLTNHRWTSTKDQVKVCVTGTVATLTCGTWIGWTKFELEVERGVCEYRGRSYIVSVVVWLVVVHGFTTLASVVMLFYIAHLVMDYRRSKLSQKPVEDSVGRSAQLSETERGERLFNNFQEYGVLAVASMIVSSYNVAERDRGQQREEKIKSHGNELSAITTLQSSVDESPSQSSVEEEPNPTKETPVVKKPVSATLPAQIEKRMKFPTHIIFLIFLSIWMAGPWVPGMISPMWFYANSCLLDLVYSSMLFLIAISPYVMIFLRRSLRKHVTNSFRFAWTSNCLWNSDTK